MHTPTHLISAADARVTLARGVGERGPGEVGDVERHHRGLQQAGARLLLLHRREDRYAAHYHHQDQVDRDEELGQVAAVRLKRCHTLLILICTSK